MPLNYIAIGLKYCSNRKAYIVKLPKVSDRNCDANVVLNLSFQSCFCSLE